MSSEIFMADYSECRDTKREVKSNVNYIDDILELATSISDYISNVPSSIFSKDSCKTYISDMKKHLNEEDAMKISLLMNPETQEMLKELAALDEDELNNSLKEISEKATKSPAELLLLDICSFDKVDNNASIFKDILDGFTTGGMAGVIEQMYLGKQLSGYNNDIKSLMGQITKLERTIANSQLSQSRINIKKDMLNNLKTIRDNKVSNVNKMSNTKNTLGSISKWLGRAVVAYQVGQITVEQWEDYSKNGVELDDAIVAAGIDGLGIAVSVVGGAKIGGAIGGAIGLPATPVGSVIGIGIGVVAGGTVGLLYGVVVEPILTIVYNDVVEPIGEWIGDVANDIGDWWDSLWW